MGKAFRIIRDIADYQEHSSQSGSSEGQSAIRNTELVPPLRDPISIQSSHFQSSNLHLLLEQLDTVAA